MIQVWQKQLLVALKLFRQEWREVGQYSIAIKPGRYRVSVAGSGGLGAVGASSNFHGGNGELVVEEIVLTSDTTLNIWVAGAQKGNPWDGAYGAVRGGDGGRAYSGNIVVASGGGGGGQSKVATEDASVNIIANGGGGMFGFAGSTANAAGGTGSGGARGGITRTDGNGLNAGNGNGGIGARTQGTNAAGNGWVIIEQIP